MEFWSEESEEKLIELWKKNACLYALIGCTLFNWVGCIADRRRQLSCVGEGVYSDSTSS